MFFFADAGGEIEGVGIATRAAIAEFEGPQFVNHGRIGAFVLHRGQKDTGCWIESVNAGAAGAEVADQQRATKDAKGRGCDGDAPGSVEVVRSVAVNRESHVADAVSAEPANETVAVTVHGTSADGVNLRIGNIDGAAYILDVEGIVNIARHVRNHRIPEKSARSQKVKARVVYVDVPIRKVSGVEPVASRRCADRQARVDVARMTCRNNSRD